MMSLVSQVKKQLNGDKEHDYYIMLSLMQKMKMSVNSVEAWNDLHLMLHEEVNMIIDCDVFQQYSKEEVEYLNNIEVLQNTIESFYSDEQFTF